MYICIAEIGGFDTIESYEFSTLFYEEEVQEWLSVHKEAYPDERCYALIIAPIHEARKSLLREDLRDSRIRQNFFKTLAISSGVILPNRYGPVVLSSERETNE